MAGVNPGLVTLFPVARAVPHPQIEDDTQWLYPIVIDACPGLKDGQVPTTSFSPIAGAPKGTLLGWSLKGGMTKNIFVNEFLPKFLRDLPPRAANEWVMLFLDGAKVHGLDDDEVKDWCFRNNLLIMQYPLS